MSAGPSRPPWPRPPPASTRRTWRRRPGTQFNYHNPNYQVAARLVEALSGETFEDYLRTHVFQPAGMPASLTTGHRRSARSRSCRRPRDRLRAADRPPAPATFDAGAGDVVSTAADMAHWLIVHTNGGRAADGTRLVSERSLKEMHTASAPNGYALGWDTDGPAGAPTRLVHSGNLLTFSAYQAVLPDSGYGVALLLNSGSALMLEQTGIFSGLLKIIEGTDSTPAAPGSIPRPSMSSWGALPSLCSCSAPAAFTGPVAGPPPKPPPRPPDVATDPAPGCSGVRRRLPEDRRVPGRRPRRQLARGRVRMARSRHLRAGGHGRISASLTARARQLRRLPARDAVETSGPRHARVPSQ